MDNQSANNPEIEKLRKIIQRNELEKIAIRTLSHELTNKLDLGEVVDSVNKYIWEMLDYSVASYIIYNISEQHFESRVYLKESVSSNFLDQVKNQLVQYISDNSQDTVVGEVASSKQLDPIFFGVPVNNDNLAEPLTNFIVPLKIDEKIIGALLINSSKNVIYSIQDRDFVENLTTIASVSFARIQTLVQSLHSRTEALLQSLSNGVIMFDLQGKATLSNPAAERFTGLPKQGYKIEELYKLFSSVHLEESVKKALLEKKVTAIPEAKISQLFYEIFVVPVIDAVGNVISGAIILHDITHVKRIVEMQTEFLSVAAHQLKTPLGSMRWNLEMMLSGDFGELNSELKEIVEQVYDTDLRLIELVNNLLKVSRIDQERVSDEPEMSNIVEIINNIVQEQKPETQKREVNYDLDLPPAENFPEILIDPNRFYEAISNLISNAIKYNKKGGSVNVKVENDDREIRIFVSDTGIGIPEDEKDRLFNRFFRATNAIKSGNQGSGLGLFVVKTYIESWGGTVEIESKEGEGSKFTIHLPLKPRQHTLNKNLSTKPHQG